MNKTEIFPLAGAPEASGFSVQPASEGSTAGVMPEFGRWQDVQRLFAIKRGTLYNLVAEGKVKSISMRRKGNKHGCRLFYLPGISAYLHSLLVAQNSDNNTLTASTPGPNLMVQAEKQ